MTDQAPQLHFDGHPSQNLVSLRDYESALWHAHDQVHDREREARDTLSRQISERFAGQNEWRQQLADERAKYITEEAYSARHEPMEIRIKALEQEMVILRETTANVTGRLFGAGAVLVVIASAAGYLLSRAFH